MSLKLVDVSCKVDEGEFKLEGNSEGNLTIVMRIMLPELHYQALNKSTGKKPKSQERNAMTKASLRRLSSLFLHRDSGCDYY